MAVLSQERNKILSYEKNIYEWLLSKKISVDNVLYAEQEWEGSIEKHYGRLFVDDNYEVLIQASMNVVGQCTVSIEVESIRFKWGRKHIHEKVKGRQLYDLLIPVLDRWIILDQRVEFEEKEKRERDEI